ncbi:MAG: sigma-70 family RNA polymerase sigma factor [Acidobacteria bacterium]|nr:sigma-70 family RNA polymerase sigma factor [Acidobacteriota bacterium]
MSARFPTTQWSRVLAARDGSDSDARNALETLCQSYWHPLYAFIRRQGHDPDAAQDLVQGYFTELLEKDSLKDVAPELGRFRSFLLASLKNFLSHDRERARALKRGGAVRVISLDGASTGTLPEPAGNHLTPEQVFEQQWALTTLDRALERLRHEAYESAGEARFEALKPYLTGHAGRTPYREVAERLGMSEGSVRAAVLRLRKQFGQALRAQIAETVADPREVDDEIRRMLSVIRPWQRGLP